MILTTHISPELATRIATLVPSAAVRSVAEPVDGNGVDLLTLTSMLGGKPGILLVGRADAPADALEIISAVVKAQPDLPVVLCAESTDVDILRAMRAGARDILATDAEDGEVREVLERALSEAKIRHAKLQPAPSAPAGADLPHFIIAIAAPKGGVGRTVLATNLATTLAQKHPGEVALVDADVQFGDVRYFLGINPKHTFVDLCREAKSLSPTDLRDRFTPHSSGLAVLPGTQSLAEAEQANPEDARALLTATGSVFRYLIVDTAATFSEFTLAALDVATDILLVSSTDIPGVRATRQMIEALDAIQLTNSRRHLVINRATDRYGITVADVEEACGLKAAALIPAVKEVAMAINQGVPVVDLSVKNPLERPLTELAGAIDGSLAAAAAPGKTRRFWRSSSS